MTYDREEFERQVNEEEKANAKSEGIKEGIKDGILTVVKNMLAKNIDVNLISELTGLSVDEINNIDI